MIVRLSGWFAKRIASAGSFGRVLVFDVVMLKVNASIFVLCEGICEEMTNYVPELCTTKDV